ncbi:MAG: [Fe-Fe] hydrogenase large subunit C-terminal domain-containing protein [Bacteroidales bacterium]
MKESVIYTEKNNCQDCYKCIKACPVKSIKMDGHSASVLFETCIYCGRCVRTCPVGAKKYRDDLSRVQHWIESGEKVVACLAPTFVTDFSYMTTEQLVKALYKLGFAAVSETAIGADIVAHQTNLWLEKQDSGVYISSACPAVVNYMHIYMPEALEHLSPIVSPMVAHARLLRKTYFPDAKIVFIGPCIAKKDEKDYHNDVLDAAVTFQNLKRWFDDERVELYPFHSIQIPNDFIVGRPGVGDLFPIDGGMLTTMCKTMKVAETDYMTFSGMEQVIDICKEIGHWKEKGKLFLELMACTGGCIKGPAMINHDGVAAKRKAMIEMHGQLQKSKMNYKPLPIPEGINWINKEFVRPYKFICKYSEEDIQEALHSIGKWSPKDELNCTGCGYDSCRALAEAMLDGKAHREMCVSCMRKEAQDKASVLLQKMPYGVVTVDDNLKVVEANRKFAEIMGDDLLEVYETVPGLKGVDLKSAVPFYSFFEAVLESGGDVIEHDIRDGDNFYHLSLMTIQQHKIVCGIIQNLREPEMQKELMIDRIREVIKQNMDSVQRIAYLLGENASFTESMLNSIVDSQDSRENKDTAKAMGLMGEEKSH